MNLFALLNRGASHADILHQREATARQAGITAAAEASRAQWLSALLTDQTRAWMSIGEADRDVLAATAIMLTIAGFCSVYDTRDTDSLDLRILRGAISAATQCSAAGAVVSVNDARAFSAAADRAATIIRAATVPAICHAAESIRLTVGLADASAPGARAATQTVVAML